MVLVTLGTGIGGGVVAGGSAAARRATASPASSVTWSSIPTVRRARAAGGAAGSATRPAPAWRGWRGRRRRVIGSRDVVRHRRRRPEAVRGEHVQAAAREGDSRGARGDRRVRAVGGARAGQPHQRARSGDVRARRRSRGRARTCTSTRSGAGSRELLYQPRPAARSRARVRPTGARSPAPSARRSCPNSPGDVRDVPAHRVRRSGQWGT